MNIFGIINDSTETLGLFEPEIQKHGHKIHLVHAQKTPEKLSTLSDADCVIMMGGPASVTHQNQLPFLQHELALITHRIQKDLPTLGVCLGAQILAAAAGARVYPHPTPERGWNTVTLTPQGIQDPLFADCEAGFLSFHWHEDTFDLPSHSTHLAFTDTCPHQAFRVGKKCYGLQFHPEVDDENIKKLAQKQAKENHNQGTILPLLVSASDLRDHKARAKRIITNFLEICLSSHPRRLGRWGKIS